MNSHIRAVKLPLPAPGNRKQIENVDGDGVFVIIGANGTGKTRLGTWLEFDSALKDRIHRISAQKSLAMPSSVSPRSIGEAEADLRYGYEKGTFNHKTGNRWSSNPNTGLLNDFDKLMVFLFSEDYEKSIAYRRGAANPAGRVVPPETKLDIVRRIWETILPYRELDIGSGTVSTRPRGKTEAYNAAEMSDGERVIFYLIGECLSAPMDGVVVIDEPELHLHKSIQALLWDAVEAERPDLVFVYLTHDLEFAASRAGAPKICLRGFDGTEWDWYIAPSDAALPEDLLLQLIGGRKPVLFVEGDETSLDYFFLRHVYSAFTLVPAGSCEHVIHAVATFRSFKELHRLDSFGLIDRDFRTARDINHLEGLGVFVLPFAAIENVLLAQPVLIAVATALHIADPHGVSTRVKRFFLAEMSKHRDSLIGSTVRAQIGNTFTRFDGSLSTKAGLEAEVKKVVGNLDINSAWAEAAASVDDILTRADYVAALTLFTHKGLLPQIGPLFGLKPGEYVKFVKRLVLSDSAEKIVNCISDTLPTVGP